MKNNKSAFTLAEVLITLGVIGVVAAMTIPVLIQKHQEKVTVTKVKKIYSVISNAYEVLKIQNGDYSEWGTQGEDDQSVIFANKIVPHLKTNKVCGYTGKGCFPDTIYGKLITKSWYNIENSKRPYKLIMADGTLIALEERPKSGKVFVDVNGFKGPNQLGKDLFAFFVLPRRVIPLGIPDDELQDTEGYGDEGLQTGVSATAWIILFENMDYLHCEGLSFNGKHKCD